VYWPKHGEISSLKVFRVTFQNPLEDISSTEPFTGILEEFKPEPEPEPEPEPFTGTLEEPESKFKSEPLVDCKTKRILFTGNSSRILGEPTVANTLKLSLNHVSKIVLPKLLPIPPAKINRIIF
jgi:hypothetical protein